MSLGTRITEFIQRVIDPTQNLSVDQLRAVAALAVCASLLILSVCASSRAKLRRAKEELGEARAFSEELQAQHEVERRLRTVTQTLRAARKARSSEGSGPPERLGTGPLPSC